MDLTVDVAVVGGGIAGVSVAAELAPTHSVAVLEQEDELAHHATGRSAAAFLETYGSAEVQVLTRASRPLLDGAPTVTPLLARRPLLWVATAERLPALAALVGKQPRLQLLTPDEATRLCPILRPACLAAAAVENDAQDIDVAALHQLYASRALRHGMAVLRGSRLLGAVRAAGRWRLRHTTGELSAALVVNAAGAWSDQVAALLGSRGCGLQPMRRTIAIGRTHRMVDAAWPLVADVDERYYFRPDGHHILLSPADESRSEPCDARPDEADVALALDLVNEATTLDIRSIVTAWAGLRTFAPDRNPVVGPDPEVPELFWFAGQGGYGIQMAPALARLAGHLVRGEPPDRGLDGLDLERLSPARFELDAR